MVVTEASNSVFVYKLKLIGYYIDFLCSLILGSNVYEVHINVLGLCIHIPYLIAQSFELF